MEQIISNLQDKIHALEEQQQTLYDQLNEARQKLITEQIGELGNTAGYTKTLERIKKYVGLFLEDNPHSTGNLRYGFHYQKEVYMDDFHEPMNDPLDFKIAEYDLLAMAQYLEIRFEYHTPAVKEFVIRWMRNNMPDVVQDDKLFGFSDV